MFKRLNVYLQYLLPQHLLSNAVGLIANAKVVWLKNFLIKNFIKLYHVNLAEAREENPLHYPCFNDFFIRHLKPELRPIAKGENNIVSPADGTIAEIGSLQSSTLISAKQIYFNLTSLFAGNQELARDFSDGSFATVYLAPHNYHRVHMPITGKLYQTIFIPGKLFSVNKMSTSIIPNIYGRNERFICLFNTEHGKAAVILVGALIVGNIHVAWRKDTVRSSTFSVEKMHPTLMQQGEELGYFSMGSTVILLFQKGAAWLPEIHAETPVQYGQLLGTFR